MTRKDKIISFAWQHGLLFIALYIMTLGISLCVKSMLGASVISVLPYVFHDAGASGLTPALSIGQYTFLMNALLVVGQISVLRRKFDPIQLFQLLVGFVFGMLIDLNLFLISWLQPEAMWEKSRRPAGRMHGFSGRRRTRSEMRKRHYAGRRLSRCPQPCDGHRIPEGQDCSRRLACAFRCCLQLHLFREMAMVHHRAGYAVCHVLCGWTVRIVSHHLHWFDRLLRYRPGFRRYIYGLARYIYRK